MRRHGFTLLEIVLVLAIVVILAALTFPTMSVLYEQQKLSAAADSYRAALLTARSRAIEEGQPYRVAIIPGMGNFRVAPDSDPSWGGGGTGTALTNSGIQPYIFEGTLSKGISLSLAATPQRPQASGDTVLPLNTAGSGQWTTAAVLLPDGSARVDTGTGTSPAPTTGASGLATGIGTDIIILPVRGRGLIVSLRALTAETSVRRANPGIP